MAERKLVCRRCNGYGLLTSIRPCPDCTLDDPQTGDGAVDPDSPPQDKAHPGEPAVPSPPLWNERPAMDPEDATHAMRVIQNDPDRERRAFALGAMSTIIATCAVFPGVKSDRMLAETLRTLRDRVPWGADEPDRGEDHR